MVKTACGALRIELELRLLLLHLAHLVLDLEPEKVRLTALEQRRADRPHGIAHQPAERDDLIEIAERLAEQGC